MALRARSSRVHWGQRHRVATRVSPFRPNICLLVGMPVWPLRVALKLLRAAEQIKHASKRPELSALLYSLLGRLRGIHTLLSTPTMCHLTARIRSSVRLSDSLGNMGEAP